MGISRRKAGSIVRCPTCAGQLVVPNSVDEDPHQGQNGGGELVFERNDFDDLLGSAAGPSHPAATAPSPAAPPAPTPIKPSPAGEPAPSVVTRRIEPPLEAEPMAALPVASAPKRPGLVVSPTLATVISVAVIAAVALAFAVGLLVGCLLRSSGG
jgi:hypothetical protein